MSPDGHWWFDGRAWVAVAAQPSRQRLPRRWLLRASTLGLCFTLGASALAVHQLHLAFAAPADVDTVRPAVHALAVAALVAAAVGLAQGIGSPPRGVAVTAATGAFTSVACFVIAAVLGSSACGTASDCDIAGVPVAVEVGVAVAVGLGGALLGGWGLGRAATMRRKK